MTLRFRPGLESLDRRDVPITVLIDHQPYNLSGGGGPDSATATLTVTDQGDGTYHWDYLLHNNSFVYGANNFWGIGRFEVPVGDAAWATNLGSSIGATSGVTGDSSGGTIWWQFADEVHPGLTPGQEADFWFNTPEVPIGPAGVDALSYDVGSDTSGPALAPVKPGAVIDFAKVDVSQNYQILITGLSNGTERDRTIVQVLPTNTATDVAIAVKGALEGMGYTVTRDGTKLNIVPPAGRTSLRFQDQTIGGKQNLNLTGPSLVNAWGNPAYDVWVNGAPINPQPPKK